MEKKLYVKFENLEDTGKTINTLFDTITILMKYYATSGWDILFEFIEQLSLYIWAIYMGLILEAKKKNNT